MVKLMHWSCRDVLLNLAFLGVTNVRGRIVYEDVVFMITISGDNQKQLLGCDGDTQGRRKHLKSGGTFTQGHPY